MDQYFAAFRTQPFDPSVGRLWIRGISIVGAHLRNAEFAKPVQVIILEFLRGAWGNIDAKEITPDGVRDKRRRFFKPAQEIAYSNGQTVANDCERVAQEFAPIGPGFRSESRLDFGRADELFHFAPDAP